MIRYFNGYILFPLLEKKIKRNILSKVKKIRQFESLPYKERKKLQRENLATFIEYTKESIPFYKNLYDSTSFDISKIRKDIRYIKELPILTKDIIRNNSHNIQNSDIQPNKILHIRKTGGSTGQSAYFYYCNTGLDWTSAFNLYALEMGGKKPHHTDCHICAELEFGNQSREEKIKLFSQNRSRLMIDHFDDESLIKYIETLKRITPFMLQGHPSSAYAIANKIERDGLKIKKPICKVFEPTGEMLTDKMVNSIERNLKCTVANRYGNAEFGVVAHTTRNNHYSELKVFERGFYIEECKQEPLIISNFTNYGFPLLRYDTGDIGDSYETDKGQYISSIQGRKHDLIKVSNSTYPTHFIMDYLDHKVKDIREFQILTYKNMTTPTLLIVPEKNDDKERISKLIKEKFKDQFEIKFTQMENLYRVGWRQKFKHIIHLES